MRGEKKLQSLIKDAAHLSASSGHARSLLIVGCQRSGTNALIGCFEDDPHAKVYREHSSLNQPSGRLSPYDTVRFSLRLRPLDQVAERLDRVRYPLAVLKPLVESQRLGELLEELPRSRALWLFRHYQDVAESNARVFGTDIHRRNLAPIVAADPSDWRSQGATDSVREFVSRHYRPEMDPVDGGALFWWARNRLLFDQGLESNPRLKPLQYDRLVGDPVSTMAELYDFAGLPFPGDRVARSVQSSFVGRGSGHTISSEIRGPCEELWSELVALDPQAA